jgi:CRP-like cAMP-binding protein
MPFMSPAQNHLIELLPGADRKRLLAVCESVELVPASVLWEPGSTMAHAYFPVDGFVSMVTEVDHHPGLEVAMVGREGMLGSPLALGITVTPVRAIVQGAGSAWRVGRVALRSVLAGSAPLKRGLDAYVSVLLAQFASAVACRRFHEIGPRLARWLLMSQDRSHADHFLVTHEILANNLGVRRVGITMAAGTLQRLGLIGYHRGHITVLDRTGLEGAACSCYVADRAAYRERLG